MDVCRFAANEICGVYCGVQRGELQSVQSPQIDGSKMQGADLGRVTLTNQCEISRCEALRQIDSVEKTFGPFLTFACAERNAGCADRLCRGLSLRRATRAAAAGAERGQQMQCRPWEGDNSQPVNSFVAHCVRSVFNI